MSTTLTVTNNLDAGLGSLREAINQANLVTDGSIQTIVIRSSVKSPIMLTSESLTITSNIHLINKTGHDLTISSNTQQRLLTISGASLVLRIESSHKKRITLTQGFTQTNGAAIYVNTSFNHQLILNYVTITNNVAQGSGGAIYTNGSLLANQCNFEYNQANIQGGALWIGQLLTLNRCKVNQNNVIVANSANGGGGIYVDYGDCILDQTHVNHNKVAYDLTNLIGGSGGGIIVMYGSLYVQNDSQVDYNLAYNSAGIQVGIGNIYLTNLSSANYNQSFNQANAAGGGGITITMGFVYINQSEVSHNLTQGMYSGGIVSLIGNVTVTNHSRIVKNSNRGPGGGIAVNLGSVLIDGHSHINDNIGASMGGGIVCFSPSPATITIANGSQVSNNSLGNAQTIKQTIEAFLNVVTNNLNNVSQQALTSGGIGGAEFNKNLPNIIVQLTQISDLLKNIDLIQIGSDNTIAGGAITSLLSATISIFDSHVKGNLSGLTMSNQNQPFTAVGGAVFGFNAKINIQKSQIKENISLSSGAGIWSGAGLNLGHSSVVKNKGKNEGNGGGIYNVKDSIAVLINNSIAENSTKGFGGGIYSTNIWYDDENNIEKNKPDQIYQSK